MATTDTIRQATRPESQPVWHALNLGKLLAAVQTSEGGLTEAEAAARLATLGPNQLPRQAPTTIWQLLLRQFLFQTRQAVGPEFLVH